jgi:hypothetical protein
MLYQIMTATKRHTEMIVWCTVLEGHLDDDLNLWNDIIREISINEYSGIQYIYIVNIRKFVI